MKNTILIQASLKPWEIGTTQGIATISNSYFPRYTGSNLKNEDWAHVEVLYGTRLTAEQLNMLHCCAGFILQP